MWAAVDHDAELPCDITAPGPQDGVKLVLWFKDSTGIPLYSLDSRSGVAISAAQHSTIASDLGQRLFFSLGTTPKEARLQIRNIKPSDGGVYRCRVDYFNSPTRNYRVNLTLVGECRDYVFERSFFLFILFISRSASGRAADI